MKEIITKQLESYSNGIVIFNVLQGLAYAYYFGSNQVFNCHVKSNPILPILLVSILTIGTIFSVLAIKYLGSKLSAIIGEYEKYINEITFGKMIIVILFGGLNIFLTAFFGITGSIPKICSELII
ncbi:MAG: hypothetical protein GY696_30250 [Gammaproteobacteria bacterium]|nr:hypothetical protein [Gammaproteobacteria bacterium]